MSEGDAASARWSIRSEQPPLAQTRARAHHHPPGAQARVRTHTLRCAAVRRRAARPDRGHAGARCCRRGAAV
eukprot:6841953-Prymnesium_polylepis.1